MRTFGGEIGAALSAFAVLFGLAATVFLVVFLMSGWWADLAAAGIFALVAVALWQVSMRRTALTPPIAASRLGRGAVRRRRRRAPNGH